MSLITLFNGCNRVKRGKSAFGLSYREILITVTRIVFSILATPLSCFRAVKVLVEQDFYIR